MSYQQQDPSYPAYPQQPYPAQPYPAQGGYAQPGYAPGAPAPSGIVFAAPVVENVVVLNGNICPTCGKIMRRGGIPIWAIILCICFFPIGLLCLLCREPDMCYSCGYRN